jgi:hypothetical protein
MDSLDTPGKGMIYNSGKMEQEGMRFRHAVQHSAQFET